MAIAAPTTAAGIALLLPFLAVQLHSFLLDHTGTSTTSQASPIRGAVLVLQALLPLAMMEAALFAALAFAYRHAPARAAAAGPGGIGNRRRLWESELAVFLSCVGVGLLQLVLFVRPAAGGGGAVGGGALGLAALRVLPAAATATYFLGLALVYALVVSTGGGNAPVPAGPAVRILSEIALVAAAALVGIVTMAVYYTM